MLRFFLETYQPTLAVVSYHPQLAELFTQSQGFASSCLALEHMT
jgi:hypothetical protein